MTAVAAPVTAAVALRPDADVRLHGDVTVIAHPFRRVAVRGLGPRITALLAGLRDRPATVEHLVDRLAVDGGSSAEIATLYLALARLDDMLVHTLDGLVRVVPVTREAAFEPRALAPTDKVRLSRFAVVRRHGSLLVLESPLARHRVELGSEAMPLVAALAGPVTVVEASRGLPAVADAHQALGYLAGAGMVDVAVDGDFPEDTDPALRPWDFHDLLFHSRSRLGRFDGEFGATFRFLGELEPEPAIKPPPHGRVVPLQRPQPTELPPLDAVLEARRSVRDYAPEPPTAAQLGELLYRSARVKGLLEPNDSMPYEASARPYPGGGATYELELYLVVRRCDGLDAGVYYYDPLGHHLVELAHRAGDAEAALATAHQATAGAVVPDVLIIVTARFRRVSWKYAGMAYATVLKNVGVLYQTFYLVATAMGLAPCGLGSGDADLSARLLGLDWVAESSVGEFLIGRA
ncbi:SagB-type dehydrogenase domain-containing protein [Nonomuraea maritima]|uniref:SagB-type dehydrogenase domain-containing protein n=1 Tax=Nonomuraea maritima TaxID=683260 RepID=A0A1G9HK00_9ACTN|nr:SagB family peptide dehydrogenase [Nonomuraea maritima]SDL13300.1 SagB-type dehydrogenase domain-containing protein [Nonomuraea maritima]